MLTADEYESRDALGLARLVADRQVSARELIETAIARIEALNPVVNAVVRTAFEEALATAEAQAARGPFGGVPYLIKDLHAPVAGMPLCNGSRLFAGNVAGFDAETVARLRRAGFVLLGRTNSPEFGLTATTEPALHGPTRNPWDTTRSAGGSSGGAGAAVASGMLPAAHATDSAGSIRIPAACNGLVGLKPTRGRNALGPHRGDMTYGLSHEHAVTRSVRDCAAILDATGGPLAGEPYVTAPPARPFLEEVGRDPGRLRIAFTTRTFAGAPVHDDCRLAVEGAARLCADLGHEVAEAAPEFDYPALVKAALTILFGSLAALIEFREAQLGRPAGPDELEPLSRAVVERGRSLTARDHAAAIAVVNREVRRIAAFFEDRDVLVSPVLSEPPMRLGALSTDTGDVDGHMARLFAYAAFTVPFNATGQPAMTLPLHRGRDGLPIGVQFAARFGEDAVLFRLAGRIEAARPWFGRRPPRLA